MEEAKNILSFRYENGKITVGGVVNVNAFDEKEVILRLSDNVMTIRGYGFKLEEMETKSGLFTMNGRISSVEYREKSKGGLLSKIFK